MMLRFEAGTNLVRRCLNLGAIKLTRTKKAAGFRRVLPLAVIMCNKVLDRQGTEVCDFEYSTGFQTTTRDDPKRGMSLASNIWKGVRHLVLSSLQITTTADAGLADMDSQDLKPIRFKRAKA